MTEKIMALWIKRIKRIFFIFLTFIILSPLVNFMWNNNPLQDSTECSTSKFNVYSNLSEGYKRFGDKCYYDNPIFYKTRKSCGLFGISCYESEEEHYEVINSIGCFNIKTGDKC